MNKEKIKQEKIENEEENDDEEELNSDDDVSGSLIRIRSASRCWKEHPPGLL